MPNIIINKNHLLVLFSHSFYSIFDFFNKDPECIRSENILCHASILDFVAFHQEWWIKRQSCEQNRHIFPITQEKKEKLFNNIAQCARTRRFQCNYAQKNMIFYFSKHTHTPDWNSFALKMVKLKISAFCETRWTSNRLRHTYNIVKIMKQMNRSLTIRKGKHVKNTSNFQIVVKTRKWIHLNNKVVATKARTAQRNW